MIERRSAAHLDGIEQSLHALGTITSDRSGIEDLIRTFVRPIAARSMSHGDGWKNYIQLLSRAMSSRQDDPFVTTMLQIFDPVREQFIQMLQAAFPEAPYDAILRSTYFLNSSLSLVLTEGGGIDRLSHGQLHSDQLDTVVERMVPFFAAGFYRLFEGERCSDA